MPKKQQRKHRTQIKDLAEPTKELSKKEQKQVKGGTITPPLVMPGFGESKPADGKQTINKMGVAETPSFDIIGDPSLGKPNPKG